MIRTDNRSYLADFATPEEYWDWARYFYSQKPPLEAISQVYRSEKVDRQTALSLNPKVSFDSIKGELDALDARRASQKS